MPKTPEAERAIKGLMAAVTSNRGAGLDTLDTNALLSYVRDLERDLGSSLAHATRLAARVAGMPSDDDATITLQARVIDLESKVSFGLGHVDRLEKSTEEYKRLAIEAQNMAHSLANAEKRYTLPLTAARRLLDRVFVFVPKTNIPQDLLDFTEDIRAFLDPPVAANDKPTIQPGTSNVWTPHGTMHAGHTSALITPPAKKDTP